nr:putative ribonuclease H-like domain-containing protein [Tanacetum cinerariifolium]
CKKQTVAATSTTEAEYVAVASCCGQVLWIQNQMLDYGSMIGSLMYLTTSKPDNMYTRLQLVAYTDSDYAGASLDRKSTTEDYEQVTTTSNDPLSGEDRLKLSELMELCTQLQSRVLAMETTKANQALKIRSLKRRVKKLEKKANKKTHKLKRLYKIGSSTRKDASKQERMIDDLDADERVALVDENQERNDQDMFDTSILDDEEVVAKKEVSTTDPVPTAGEVVTIAVTIAGDEVSTAAITSQISMAEITLAKALIDIKTSKPKAKGIVIQEPSETPTPTPIDSFQQPSKAKDKGKAKMIKPEKPLKRKDHMQAELEEEERLARQKEEEDNIALIKSWDNTQAMMDADYELVARLQEEERGELTIKEKSSLFVELMNKIKKHFARLRAEKVRRLVKGSEKATEGSKNAAESSEKAEKDSSKRPGYKLEEEDVKRQKIKEENESAELKRCLEIILDDDGDDVTIEATPLSSKSPTIVDYKIYKEGRKSFFKIIKGYGNSQNYLTFGKMFKNFNREDLEVLWSIVKARFKKTKPVDDMDNLLF